MNERVLNGRYVLESEIGRGGMGVVYKAKDTQLDRYVAIKVLPAEFGHDIQFLERFRREVLNSAKLDHPHVAHVHDVGADSDTHYYVMQLIEGSDLHSEIKSCGSMTLDECTRILGQVAQALDYAHQRGIVHRDIKPENILLDTQRNAHVVDFGIAKSVEGTRLTGGMIGTPAYMSPEQGRGEEVDGRSDQYALAIVAYEMLTGATPFRSDTTQPWALVNRHISTAPPDPRQFRPDLPDCVCSALMRALSKQPSERFASCTEFASAMKSGSASDDMPVPSVRSVQNSNTQVAPRIAVDAPSGSLLSRLRVFVALAVVALLVGGGLVSWSLFGRSDHSPAVETKAKSDVPTARTASSGESNVNADETPGNVVKPNVTPASSVQPTITEGEVRQLLDAWLLAQNNRDVAAYSACYSPEFKGIKRTTNGKAFTYDYSGWLLDRKKMLTETRDLRIDIENVTVATSPDSSSAEAEFTQYFRTAKYGDKGPKVMRFKKSNSKIKITYEEMKWSTKL